MKESRMDRIEKGMEEFFRGMAELRESQKKTDEHILELKESRKKTDESFRRVHEEILELKESQKKTDEQLNRTDEQLNRTDEQLSRTDENLKRTEANIDRTEAQLNKTIKKLDDIGAKLGEMGIIQGKVAEDLFYRNVRHAFGQKNMAFSDVRRNLKKKGIAEYDIVAAENNTVLVISVKNKLERYMIDSFLNEKLPKFREVFPQYRDFRLLGGVGALVMDDGVGRYAEKKGLYVMTQNGEGGAMLVNRKNFTAKEF
jgi:chromosome segregation ATPase